MGFEKTPDQPKVEKTAEEEAEEKRKKEHWAREMANKVEREVTPMPNGLKEILAGGYGLAATLFSKDKEKGFLKTFLEKREVAHKSLTAIDDTVVESNFDDFCQFYEKFIATLQDPEKKIKHEKLYDDLKADQKRKIDSMKRDRERNDKVENAFRTLLKSFGG